MAPDPEGMGAADSAVVARQTEDPLLLALGHHFGWSRFRAGQRAVVEALLEGRDCLAVLPTGGGKSLCYQLPALLRQGLVVVVSPLVALMQDQVSRLRRRGIAAACLHSGMADEERLRLTTLLRQRRLRLLYLAPERIRTEATRQLLEDSLAEGDLVALAVDEAHCISAWGHDFRPDYRRLDRLRRICPGVPMVALSATAAPRVRADIIRLLALRRPLVQVSSARRPNLRYAMRLRPPDPLSEVLAAIDRARGAKLIYVRTRRSAERWADRLTAAGVEAIGYHAGMDGQSRRQALVHFQEAAAPVLVATAAFGMGVDRSDVGLVLHLDLPASPESYLQESGRAGRDERQAECLVLFRAEDRTSLGWAMRVAGRRGKGPRGGPEHQRLEWAQQQLRRMEAIAEGQGCLEQALLLAVGERVSACGRCDRCRQPLARRECSEEARTVLFQLLALEGGAGTARVDSTMLCAELARSHPGRPIPWGWLVRRLVQEGLLGESDDGGRRLVLQPAGRSFLRRPWRLAFAGLTAA